MHVSAVGERAIAIADLAPDRNQLQFDYTAPSFALGQTIRYQYKLEGADADWSAPGEGRAVNYASLAPGRYRFLVRGIGADGDASAVPATIAFVVLRPVWQRWWFVSLVLVGSAFAIWFFVIVGPGPELAPRH